MRGRAALGLALGPETIARRPAVDDDALPDQRQLERERIRVRVTGLLVESRLPGIEQSDRAISDETVKPRRRRARRIRDGPGSRIELGRAI